MRKTFTDVLLKVEKLKVVYHNVSTAVEGVSLEVRENEIVALLGINGAGKTTTLRAISGFLPSDNARIVEGLIEFQNEQIQNKLPHEITRKGVVLVPERDKIFETLTVEEHLKMCIASAGNTKKERAAWYDLIFRYFPLLGNVKNRLAGYLSGGERQMLALSTALLCKPKLLLVDELSLGLAPIIVDELLQLLKIIRDERNITILLVEQNASAALQIADYGYVMENGRVVFAGDPEQLKKHKDIQEFYLGQGETGSRKSYREIKQYRRSRRWYG